MKAVIKILSSGLYTGYSPVAPGSVGSLLGVLIFIQLYNYPAAYILICFLITALGFLICPKAEEIFKQKDSKKIVIDEVAGMCIVYLGMPANLWIIVTGYIIYRIFDIIKPPPAKQMHKLRNSTSVMLDDIIVAVYTNIILQILIRLPLNIGS